MKKLPLIAAIVLAWAVATPRLSAQSAMFTYTGVPAGPVVAGSSFTIGLNIVLTTGGNINSIVNSSYWFYQVSPFGGPFPFAITGFDGTGSLFTTTTPVFPISLNAPSGGFSSSVPVPGLPSGTYFIGNLMFSVAPNGVPGSYTLGNTTSTTPGVGGRISVFADAEGDTAPFAASNFNINVVPEPSSIALLCVGLISAGALAYRRRVAAQ